MRVCDFFEAAESGNIELLEAGLREGISIEVQNEKGWNALVMAAYNQHFYVVKYLIESGANVNHASANGTTVFMYAKTKVMETGNYRMLKYLLGAGANINQRDYKNGWTVLQYVKNIGHTEMERFLISNGATI